MSEGAAQELPPRSKLRPIEVANYLQISLATVYELMHSGEIPSQKIGRQFRVPRSEFLAWDRKRLGDQS